MSYSAFCCTFLVGIELIFSIVAFKAPCVGFFSLLVHTTFVLPIKLHFKPFFTLLPFYLPVEERLN